MNKLKGIKQKVNILVYHDAYQKTLEWFFNYPTREISLTDLASNIRISKSSAKSVIELLVQEGFIKKEVLGRVWRLYCNQEHPYNVSRKIGFNLIRIYESGILEEIHNRIKGIKAVVLFGSYRKGDDTEKSDIDIAIEVLGDIETKIEPIGMVKQMSYRTDVTVNLCIFSRSKVDLNLFSNIANGIVLQGFLEVKP
ncbi:MAG: nucleotidyltransferase domain-containing protein [Nanoarchaeota archaeon]